MTIESIMQEKCVTWFHNNYPEHRKSLIMRKNETNRGANYKKMGLVTGASDLDYTMKPNGKSVFFELKAENTRHVTKHLINQLEFSVAMAERGAFSFFIFSFGHFRAVMEALNILGDNSIKMKSHAQKTRKYVADCIKKSKGKKTAVIGEFDYSNIK